MAARSYATPEGFRMALEQRIRRAAQAGGRDMSRFRQLLVFDRFLARVFTHLGDRVVAKGGLILELRLKRARTTKDVDLHMKGDPKTTLQALREAGQLDLGDYLSFTIEPDRHHPTIQGEGMVYAGQRFRAEAGLAGKLYGNPFGVDVGYADAMTMEPELVGGTTFLDFVGVEPAQLRIYPRPTHIAEKLHAYTLPRDRDNTRSRTCPTSPCWPRLARSPPRSSVTRSPRRSSSAEPTPCRRACPSRRPSGRPSTRAWRRRMTCSGER